MTSTAQLRSSSPFPPPGARGECAQRIADLTEADTPLGPACGWSPALRMTVDILLAARAQIVLFWGPEYVALYNDAYAPSIGSKHPHALGRPAREHWTELWDDLEPLLRGVRETGETFHADDRPFYLERHGYGETVYFDVSYSAVPEADGSVGGVLCIVSETTERVRSEAALRDSESRLRLALEGAKLGTWDWDLRELRGAWSPRTREIFGVGPDLEIDVELRSATIHPDDRERVWRELVEAAQSDGELVSEYRILRPNGDVRWIISRGAFDRDAAGTPIRATGIVLDVTERVAAEQRLRETSRRLNAVLDNASVAIFLMDADHQCVYMNAAAEALTGYSLAETRGQHLHDVIHHSRPDGSPYPAHECPIDGVNPDNGRAQGEEVFIDKAGRFIPVAFTASSIRNEDGQPVGTIIEVQDITARKKAEEHQLLLINELNHRAKNLLSIIQGVSQQSFKGERGLPEMLGAFEGRLGALAAAHNLLTEGKWEAASLRDVIAQTIAAVCPGADRIALDGADMLLPPKTAVSLAMAVHELATNALKYGGLSAPEGRVDIRWTIDDERLHLVWRESGGPAVRMPSARGFGTRMIERGLAAELQGSVTLEFAASGVVCTIDAPIREGT